MKRGGPLDRRGIRKLTRVSAEEASRLTLTLSGEAIDSFVVALDGKSLRFSSGRAQTAISPGSHDLAWTILATPGTTVTLAIEDPAEARWIATERARASGRWLGRHAFAVSGTRAVPSDCHCTGPLQHRNPPPAGSSCRRCGATVVCV